MEIALDYDLTAGAFNFTGVQEPLLTAVQEAFSYPRHDSVCISQAAGQTSSPSLT
jgi:hypothetical protein